MSLINATATSYGSTGLSSTAMHATVYLSVLWHSLLLGIQNSTQRIFLHPHFRAGGAWQKLSHFLEQPYVYKPLLAFIITFLILYIFLCCVGFQAQGVVAGSLAAAFQSWAYGAFTPAGGLFAMLTGLGMMGLAQPVFFMGAFSIASVVAVFVFIAVGPVVR